LLSVWFSITNIRKTILFLGFCRNYFKAKTALAYPELGEKGCEPTKENKQQTKKKNNV